MQGRKNTGPYGAVERGTSMKQTPIRVHRNDWEVAKVHMLSDKVNFQQMMSILFEAYVKRDEYVVELVRRTAVAQKAVMKTGFTLSNKEKSELDAQLVGDESEDPEQP